MEVTGTVKKSSILWRLFRWGLIGLAGLITLLALVWTEENWRGKRAWENYRKEQAAKGEKLELADFVPPPVPDDQNFAMTPFLAPIFDLGPDRKPRDTNAVQRIEDLCSGWGNVHGSGPWTRARQTDLTAWATALDNKKDVQAAGESPAERAASAGVVLQKLKKYEPVMEELQQASQRPHCQFKILYASTEPVQILLPHLAVLKKFSVMFGLRASAELASGRTDDALRDVQMGFYLADTIKDEPFLISGLVNVAIVNVTLQPVWEGLADHRWSDAQLKQLQEQLQKHDMLKSFEHNIRGERACANSEFGFQRRARRLEALDGSGNNAGPLNLMPSGLWYQNQLTINRMYSQIALPEVEADNHRVRLDLTTNAEVRANEIFKKEFYPYTIFARMLFPAVSKASLRFACSQAYVDEATIACALERYRLAHGEFPEKLDALSPQYIEKIPMDVATGEPLKYRRTGDGKFILYSVGWNGVDDGGKVVLGKGKTPSVDVTQGDWVWQY